MAKRGYGEGSIRCHTVRRVNKAGEAVEYTYWRAVLPGGALGRRRYFQSRSEKAARAWLRENIGQRGLPDRRVSVTVGDYAVDWLHHTSLTVKPATADFYRAALRHLAPVSTVPLPALTPAHVRDLVATETEAGKSSRTVRGIVQTLALVLRRAQEDGLVERNVAALIRLPKLETKEPRHFTAAQARRFLDGLGRDPLDALYAVALTTGLRRGELLALTWRDVDLEGRSVRVRRSKTQAGLRSVPIGDHAADRLAALDRGLGPIWDYRPEYVTRHFQDLCRQAGVPVITLHGLRHTAASLMLDAGVDPLVIQQIIGHTTVSMTGHYARAGEALRRDAVERLGRAVG